MGVWYRVRMSWAMVDDVVGREEEKLSEREVSLYLYTSDLQVAGN